VGLPSPCFILLFFQGVCGSYSGVVRLPVKMYERVKIGMCTGSIV
jgi:hypothetical protein